MYNHNSLLKGGDPSLINPSRAQVSIFSHNPNMPSVVREEIPPSSILRNLRIDSVGIVNVT